MKKLLCILLSVVLVIGTSAFAVNAAVNPKIENDLAEEINEGSQEIISVYIWLKQIASESEIESIVAEKYTWANEQEHLKYYRTELRNIVAPYVQQFVDENAKLIENIRFQGKNVEFIIADVKKDNITTLAESDLVTGLSLYEELVEPVAEDTEKLFQDAFVDWSVNEFG